MGVVSGIVPISYAEIYYFADVSGICLKLWEKELLVILSSDFINYRQKFADGGSFSKYHSDVDNYNNVMSLAIER